MIFLWKFFFIFFWKIRLGRVRFFFFRKKRKPVHQVPTETLRPTLRLKGWLTFSTLTIQGFCVTSALIYPTIKKCISPGTNVTNPYENMFHFWWGNGFLRVLIRPSRISGLSPPKCTQRIWRLLNRLICQSSNGFIFSDEWKCNKFLYNYLTKTNRFLCWDSFCLQINLIDACFGISIRVLTIFQSFREATQRSMDCIAYFLLMKYVFLSNWWIGIGLKSVNQQIPKFNRYGNVQNNPAQENRGTLFYDSSALFQCKKSKQNWNFFLKVLFRISMRFFGLSLFCRKPQILIVNHKLFSEPELDAYYRTRNFNREPLDEKCHDVP